MCALFLFFELKRKDLTVLFLTNGAHYPLSVTFCFTPYCLTIGEINSQGLFVRPILFEIAGKSVYDGNL